MIVRSLPRTLPRMHCFSLIELVIVVVIVGVIAAIAVPRITSSYGRTSETSLVSNLSNLRRAIDTYAAEHNDTFPGSNADGVGGAAGSAAAFLSQLTKFSASDGRVSNVRDSTFRFGPYLQRMPEVPVGKNTPSRNVAIDSVNTPPVVTTGPEGWVYNPSTGEIIANSDNANFDGSRAFDEY